MTNRLAKRLIKPLTLLLRDGLLQPLINGGVPNHIQDVISIVILMNQIRQELYLQTMRLLFLANILGDILADTIEYVRTDEERYIMDRIKTGVTPVH